MIESVLRLMGKGRQEAEGLEIFSRLLFSSTFDRSLEGVAPSALVGFAGEAFAHLLRKPHKRHALGFRSTGLLAGRGEPLLVLEILGDDKPFVVESVMGELHARGIVPRQVFHPIFKVKRYGSGNLQAVVGPGDGNWAAGDQESYIAVLMDPLGEGARKALADGLDMVLDDVRHAATDADAIRTRVLQAIGQAEKSLPGLEPVPGMPAALDIKEALEFLSWLLKGNFTLLGARDYELVGADASFDLWPAAASPLGVLRRQREVPAGAAPRMPAELQAIYSAPELLVVSKSSETSRVRRRVPLDCIGIKRYSPAGRLVGELRVVGLFTPASYMQPVEAVPLVRQKVRRVLAESQLPPDSHSGRTLVDILETFPRDELFRIEQRKLQDWSTTLLDLDLKPRVAVMTSRDLIGRCDTALVFVPRDAYSSTTRERIGRFLEQQLGVEVAAFQPYITARPLVRIQFTLAHGSTPPRNVPEAELARGIVEILRTWDERVALAVAGRFGDGQTPALISSFQGAFSAGYAETYPVERAVEDIARIERLGPERPVAIDFYRDASAHEARVRAAIYRFDAPIPLSERVPLLENLGFRVIDERSHRVRPLSEGARRDVVLHDMVLESVDGAPVDLARHDARMEEAFLAAFHGQAENDAFNLLVIAAGRDWREAEVMRALAAYMRQMRAPFSPRYIAETLARYPAIASDLNAMFRARFDDPAGPAVGEREAKVAAIRQRVEEALNKVTGLDEDRIIRRLLNLIAAIVRTNAFARDAAGQPPATLAFKLAAREIDRLPEPKPYREIFVYSPRVEGVHLRFGPIARGGIRWSDRAQDFRTEVLGLAKAQQVKNTVIVPTGAKGGFVPKQLKRNATREEIQAEGVACYRIFIDALLSLTDEIRDGRIVPPPGIVRHDGDDPYLVVAADKGTATFSDYANAISLARGFWLGDAFASGGSAGYDHKRLGITARGAWECVKRHFREMDVDIEAQPFRVVGVGDMSGDVFGNAMLLSPHIRLVAAFDHRDIFLDPEPDVAASFAERKRLFELPRSSWADYDRARISAGGGVYSRQAKSIPLSAPVKAMLGVEGDALAPTDLMQVILRCETDLLWFGGIGTFIRESNETDDQAGDRANDAIRISAAEVRAKVVGEGANLGLTQRARIEAASRGVRLNTDFIDNSAGVNTSDQEVNIKIALEPAIASGRLPREERNRLLAAMSNDVAAAVLSNNHAQSLALSLAERNARRDNALLGRLARQLEERGLIDRKLEVLPSGTELAQRAAAGGALTRPELAVMMSWAKIALNADLVASTVPDTPEAEGWLVGYFPPALREAWRQEIAGHRLRREIVATAITNTVINVGGPALVVRLAGETGETVPEIVETFLAVQHIFGLSALWAELGRLDGVVPGPLQLDLYAGLQDLAIDEAVRLSRRRGQRSFGEMAARYRPAAAEIAASLPGILPQAERARLEAEAARLKAAGVPADLAQRLAGIGLLRRALPLVELAGEDGAGVAETARVVFAAADMLSLEEVGRRAGAMPATDDFDRQAIARALAVIDRANSAICDRMLHDPAARGVPLMEWAKAHAPQLLAAKPLIDRVLAEDGLTLARLDAIADSLRGLT